METLLRIFGDGKDLNVLQMCCRGFVVFIIALILIRIAGRRSFGLKRPLDNIIVILLGTVLGRAIVGVSPFIPTVAASLLIVLLHRVCAWVSSNNRVFSRLINGEKILVYKNGVFYRKNMKKSLVKEEDVLEEVRLRANLDDMKKIEAVYMEKNGEMSSIKKE